MMEAFKWAGANWRFGRKEVLWRGSHIGCQQPADTFCSLLSSSIWRPSEVKFAHPDVSRQRFVFCYICVWKHRSEELPHHLLVSDWGRRILSFFLTPPPPPCLPASLTVLNFLFDLAIKSLLFFVSDVCRAWLGKWLAEEDVWENAPEQAITFDKAIVPVGEEEESQRIRALLLMKNAMQEGASLWSLPVKPALDCTTDTAVVHQAFAWRSQRTDLSLGYHALPLWRISLAGSLSLRRQWLN